MTSQMEPLLINVQTAAERLQVSVSTVWRLIERGDLPTVRLSKRTVRIRTEDFNEYVRRAVRRAAMDQGRE